MLILRGQRQLLPCPIIHHPFCSPKPPMLSGRTQPKTQEPSPAITPTTQKTAHPVNDVRTPENGFSFYGMFLSRVHSLHSLKHVIQRQLQTLIRSRKQVSPFTHRVCKHPSIHTATIPFHFISWEKQNKTGIERLLGPHGPLYIKLIIHTG